MGFNEFMKGVSGKLKEEFEYKKELRDIEREEYKKAMRIEAKKFARQKAAMETKDKIKKLKKKNKPFKFNAEPINEFRMDGFK